MITYVNTVLVGKGLGLTTASPAGKATKAEAIADAGKFIVEAIDDNKFRIGLITNKTTEAYINGKHTYSPIVRWSNEIKKADIKGMAITEYVPGKSSEDTITIDFSEVNAEDMVGKRIVVRLTFKDTPTRYRKWTESYEYTVKNGDEAADIAAGIQNQIVRNYKRARIEATVEGNAVKLEAMPYDDDEVIDSISPANKVRFSASMWMTDPQAAGFASKNKYSVDGAVITKEPGFQQVGEWKLVRDAEAQAMGYMGILNRGECTWPIIKPDMNVQMGQNYDTLTLEFENMYRAADDIFRKTKQTVQVFGLSNEVAAVATAIKALVPEIVDINAEA